jgi:hypothetical protein
MMPVQRTHGDTDPLSLVFASRFVRAPQSTVGHVAVHRSLGRVVCRSHAGRAGAIRAFSRLQPRSDVGSIEGKMTYHVIGRSAPIAN